MMLGLGLPSSHHNFSKISSLPEIETMNDSALRVKMCDALNSMVRDHKFFNVVSPPPPFLLLLL